MQKTVLYALVIAISALAIACTNQTRQFTLQDGLVIKNGLIITADTNEQIHKIKGYIVVDTGRIIYVSEKEPQVTGNFKTIDAAGKFVTPGLIDSHVHLGHPIGISDEDYEARPELVEAYFNQLPRSYLYFGYTTVIDLDLRERTRKQFEATAVHPRLFGSGRGIRIFDGYGQSLFPKPLRYRIFPNWVYNPEQKSSIPESFDAAEHTVDNVLKEVLKTNPVCTKTYYEAGFGGAFNWPVPSDSILSEIVKQSHDHGLPVAIHANSASGYKAGLRAGIDIFAHGLWHWEGEPLDATPTPETHEILKQMADKGSYMQPTTRVIRGEYDDYTWGLINHPEIKNVLPEVLIRHMQTPEGQFAKREITDRYNTLKPDSDVPNDDYFRFGIDKVKNTTRLANDFGVKILFGSDTPAAAGIGNPPGLNGYLEMQSLHESGLTPEDIFIAATIRNATAFKLQHKIGSIQTGLYADLLILTKDPLKTIEAFKLISNVVIDGEMISRDSLKAK
jgi:imidazolonepropionase-like amidohydrolase